MDLRSIINSEAGEGAAPKAVTPITPVQSGPPPSSSREAPPQPALNKHPSQDYGQATPGPYASPAAYPTGYHGRPSGPPPLLPPSQNDLRSPAGSSHYSAQSPYRHTPSSSVSGGAYPFSQQTPQSPAPPPPYASNLQRRESYSQSSAAPPQLQHHNSYSQASPVPQTPPVGASNVVQSYFHQRSQSSQSNSTPTSAHSQQPYQNQYSQDSPISTSGIPPSALPQHQPQQSQPGTPLGPPISVARQSSGGFVPPTSPYQQKSQSTGTALAYHSNLPGSPAPMATPTQETNRASPLHDAQRRSIDGDMHRRSQTEKERSISVSPKTQVSGLPKSENATNSSLLNGAISNTKRKMDERENSEASVNYSPTNGDPRSRSQVASASPLLPMKKRVRYTEPPIWARSKIGRVKTVQSEMARRNLNGRPMQQHAVLTTNKAGANGHKQTQPKSQASTAPNHEDGPNPASALLGPWEPSITGMQPYDEIGSLVSDWLFQHVVNRPDAGELASRGVEVEIEAKLGQLTDKDTNERYRLPVRSECVLIDTGRVSFRSSMTEAQHKGLNDFLNTKVQETHPGFPGRKASRVSIIYAHRNERDTFYELPPSFHSSLPACIRRELNPRHTVKVRVTTDAKTGQLLAKIIKVRVTDLDIYLPRFPLDCRISVNLEMRYDGDIEELRASAVVARVPDRIKNRITYTHSHYQVDLTQVTVEDSVVEVENELEIELSSAAVREQGQRVITGDAHKFPELIQGLVDNVRVLTRNAPGPEAVL